ncbi:hypothetical protein EB796_001658 [Bugula neritina]|uniref:Uncharacterized protein n=1 Tax=Bugula neritina TaxID=10212 RepID=A0A7J7KPE9_BUGNE|nr:hypothetical protein EB796_001658 [Bugula neritina]
MKYQQQLLMSLSLCQSKTLLPDGEPPSLKMSLTLQGVASSLQFSFGSNDPIPADLLEELFIVTNPIESLYCEGMAPLKPIKYWKMYLQSANYKQ